MNTVRTAVAAPIFQGQLFPSIFRYNKGRSDSISKSKQSELKGTQQFMMKQLS